MASSITRTTLEHLAKLSRIELDPKEEEKLLKDLGEILDYFTELEKLDTASVQPMAGGTDLKDVLRGDEERENTDQGGGADAFPEKESGFLKIPPVFE
ncbi:MAG: Asp-tRNA(Asn)/Glu-tRNA(Gln) amidotransferase subunit GatC [Patescibacteria group bacterium]|nr:Asp-tRNA(Asn)/Glu-tRNA(Gln) amidotransferase subunit GatC [Patescibacteria group bacterium]